MRRRRRTQERKERMYYHEWAYLEMEDSVISLYVTPLMVPVSPSMALIRIPVCTKQRPVSQQFR